MGATHFYDALAIFQSYRDLEAGDTHSPKQKWREQDSNPGPISLQAKRLTTQQSPLPHGVAKLEKKFGGCLTLALLPCTLTRCCAKGARFFFLIILPEI